MMDAFSYLSVLLSIIIGLAITQVLQGYRALLLNRRRVTLYAPPMLWSGSLLLIAVQMWWSSFGLAGRTEWTFLIFSIILLQTVLLYMLAGLVLPDMPPSEPLDLNAHYYRERIPFGFMLGAIIATSALKNLAIDGGFKQPAEAWFHVAFLALAVLIVANRRAWVHLVIAVGTSLLLIVYVALLFARL